MPQTRRDIVILVIVAVLLCGGIAFISAQFEKSYRSQHIRSEIELHRQRVNSENAQRSTHVYEIRPRKDSR
jgi:hypothetical protein